MRYLTLFTASSLTLVGLLLMFTPFPGATFARMGNALRRTRPEVE